ncbi:Cytoskeleton-associated Gly-rich domain protein [Rutstroemia sp. NJR-2017a BVV2]|nr:Cytoskeleton-associated Gly-rich domain protein [Rutstroemia sp. NJR-2017a BVV2]
MRSPKKNTKSTPNLNSLYNKSVSQSTAPPVPTTNNGFDFGLNRQASLASLTSGSLAALPDATKRYPLSTVLDERTPTIGNMPPFTPSRFGGSEDVEVGDLVDVPGNMYGTVKFVGTVQGKKGTFAGVELSEEFASKGKNNGDVDG